ncbi:MAG: aminoacyl-tRNA hydrolase [Alloprevotella sp.]|nr:aminoacyl-tRNA hydrolase [Alloprevotella sp.]MBR1651817.1 aminoacyl-tRNA hydrolase [Alloprevotella sp.]
MLHLIACLGNIGDEYAATRHNIGFRVADKLAAQAGIAFQDKRYGFVGRMRVKNQELLLLKPSTYMNLSGNAVRYWMQKENIPLERLLVVVDDLSLPFGTLRMKPGGSEAGHNGLRSITQQLGTQQYARLRFGIGNDFQRGGQIDFVLGEFLPEELEHMDERVTLAADAVKAYALSGIAFAMNNYNNK